MMEIYCGFCEDNGESPIHIIQDCEVVYRGSTVTYKCPRCESVQGATNG